MAAHCEKGRRIVDRLEAAGIVGFAYGDECHSQFFRGRKLALSLIV
jgi:hypothetical protein